MKKILLNVIAILMFSLPIFAANNALTEGQQGPKEVSKIRITIPSENIKPVPILGYKLVYIETEASVLDFLDKTIDKVNQELSSAGVTPNNNVIIFLNYEGYSKNNNPSYNPNEDIDSDDEYNSYTTSEGITLNLKSLLTKYSIAFLTTKRKVLVGALIRDSLPFNGTPDLKVLKFNMPDAKGLQYMSNAYYANERLEAISETNNKNADKNGPTPTNGTTVKFNNNNAAKQLEDAKKVYTKEELVAQRVSMIQYMNLEIFRKTPFIGMMEMLDDRYTIYNYFALPGKTADFFPVVDKNTKQTTTNNN